MHFPAGHRAFDVDVVGVDVRDLDGVDDRGAGRIVDRDVIGAGDIADEVAV